MNVVPSPAHLTGSRRLPRALAPSRAPRALVALLGVLVALATVFTAAPSAQAADSYVYWGYWQLSGAKWTFSQVGAGGRGGDDDTGRHRRLGGV